MVNVSLKREELKYIKRLVAENRDSAKLQRFTELSYMDSINLLNKLRKY